jgi:hypothetical protein
MSGQFSILTVVALAVLSLHEPPGILRTLRAILVLEYIGSPQARQLITRLVAGAPAASETRSAQRALQRLGG